MTTTTTDRTAAMIDVANGMNELAIAHIRAGDDLPHGTFTGDHLTPVEEVAVTGGTEVQRRELVDRVAAALGVPAAADYYSCQVTADGLSQANYVAQACFGPVTYRIRAQLDSTIAPAPSNVVPLLPPAPPARVEDHLDETEAAALAALEELAALDEAAQ